MTTDRLSKSELVWLLAQEARSASQKLRQGVGLATIQEAPQVVEEQSGGVERTLERLDEAVTKLANLYGGAAPRGKRGKIDVAALLWEVAPDVRVQLEMGEGTTVYGEENELRRMLHMLLGQPGKGEGGRASAEVSIRRIGDEVRVGASLGPDPSTSHESERAWLARMATRYGGRLELDGTMQTLVLPADVDRDRREVETLRKELAAAQERGLAYARELAAQAKAEPSSVPSASGQAGGQGSPGAASMTLLVTAARALGAELRGIFSAIGRDIAPLRGAEGEAGEIAGSVGRHVMAASDVMAELAWIAACPAGEAPRDADLADLARDVVRTTSPRAARRGVTIRLEAPESAFDVIRVGALVALLHALLDQAVLATPAGEVFVSVSDHPDRTVFVFDDAGPAVPAEARGSLRGKDIESSPLGRPAGLPLLVALALASELRADLELDASPAGGARLRLVLPRAS